MTRYTKFGKELCKALAFSIILLLKCAVAVAQCPAPVATNVETYCSGTFTLKATTSSSSVTSHKWYTVPTGGTPIAITKISSPSASVLVSELTANFGESATYYVSSVCGASETLSRTIVYFWKFNAEPVITPNNVFASCPGSFTLSAKTNDREVTAHNWYTTETGGTPVAITRTYATTGNELVSELTANFSSSTSYYVSAVYCSGESQTRKQVALVLPFTQVSSTDATGCVGTYTLKATTTDVSVTSHNWYNASVGGSPVVISKTTKLGSQVVSELTANFSATVTYYVAAVRGDCMGEQSIRMPVKFTLIENTVVSINPTSTVTACQNDDVKLTATGGKVGSYKWYANQVGSEILSSNDSYSFTIFPSVPTATTTYYVTGINSCDQTLTASVPVKVVRPCTSPNNYSYIRETIVKAPGVLNVTDVQGLVVGNKIENSVYLDGSGNPNQAVTAQFSPGKKDIVKPIAYDNLGRNAISYLPIQYSQTASGNYVPGLLVKAKTPDPNNPYNGSPHQLFYQNFTDKVPDDVSPFSQLVFENSPISRVTKQGSLGTTAQPSTGAYKALSYETNSTNEIRKWTIASTGLPVSVGACEPGILHSLKGTNEEGIVSKIYYDGQNLKILEKNKNGSSSSGWTETYFVYDVNNNLRYVLPPEFTKLYPPGASSASPSQSDLDNSCTQYRYDKLNRQIQMKSPGSDWLNSVYDSRDRLVLSQDGNQRINNEWSYKKYDELDRVVISGIYRPGTSITLAVMQNNVDALAGGAGYQNISAAVPASSVFPTSNDEPLLKIYYDNYACEFCQDSKFQFVNENWGSVSPGVALTSNEPFAKEPKATGRVVASSAKILGDNIWLNSVLFYNRNGQVLQAIKSNHLGGYDRFSTLTDFDGKIVSTLHTPVGYNSGGITALRKRMTYDHAGRLLNTYHQINTQPEVILTSYVYNELGQVVKKKIHGVGSTPKYLQSIDYRYNIQGLVTAINNDIPAETGDPTEDYFGMNMIYDANNAIGNTPRKDGYISSIKWKHDLSPKQQVYNYFYDDQGRLSGSKYKLCCNEAELDFFNEDGITYDLNGNITGLRRTSKKFDGTSYVPDEIDALRFRYASLNDNKLLQVDETSNSDRIDLGFKNGTNTGSDYDYDANGNIIKDQNKSIRSITYNFMNLPVRATFEDNSYMDYKYDATGTKLSQIYGLPSPSGVITSKTDYNSGFVLVNDQVLQIDSEEGRIIGPTYANLFNNRDANSLDGYTATANVDLSNAVINGQTYIKEVCNTTSGTPGIFPIRTTKGDIYTVTAGETYSFRVLGYQAAGTKASLYVWTNKGNLVWPGAVLMQGAANENWVTVTFTIPTGATQLKLGVKWSKPGLGNTVYINRVALYKLDYEYQYFLTDQVGSPRVVLQTNPNTITYTATMETEHQSATVDNGGFENVNTNQLMILPEANGTPGGNEVIRLNQTYKIGPSKNIKVYPGDKIDLSTYCYFMAGTFSKAPITAMVTSVATSLGGAPGVVGEVGSIYKGVNDAYNFFGLSPDQGTTAPSAFLNYILFDKDFNPVAGKSLPVPSTAAGTRQLLVMPQISVLETGYIYVYLSYDNSSGSDVYFDELKIVHTESPVIQVNGFYPYGMMAFSWTREGETDTREKYQAKEYDAQTGWHYFPSRQYDATLGRWLSQDPAKQFVSGYAAMGGNPVMSVDPNGEYAVEAIIIGAIIGAYIGGTLANDGEMDPQQWDFNSGRTWSYMAAGAVIGGVSGGIGSEVAASGMPLANTAGIMVGSFVNSVGTSLYSGGKTDVSVGFGIASYNVDKQHWGYLGKKGNSTLENVGYGFGALANLADINLMINSTQAELYTDDTDWISHSAVREKSSGDILMSYGPNDTKVPSTNLGFLFRVRKGTSTYTLHDPTPMTVDINVNKYTMALARGVGKLLPYQGATINCTNMSSLSLWLNGIPNIGIHPYMLYATTWAYANGIRPDLFSYYSYQH